MDNQTQMEKKEPKIVILGGGPTGLGAAYRLSELGIKSWSLYEKHDYLGGHSSTHTDEKGFLWDEGGHVLFSHYPYYDEFVKKVLQDDYYMHERESWIVRKDSRVPYPFQNNLRYLPKEVREKCLLELAKANYAQKNDAKNFKEWIIAMFGQGIADAFMLGYNYKVWATPPEKMSKEWISERVSLVSFESALHNVIHERDDMAWGPNNKFIFPKYGGTGEIYQRSRALFADHIHEGKKAVSISFKKKEITFEDGEKVSYDYLISAIPLTTLTQIAEDVPSEVREAAQRLTYNSVIIIGLGLEKKIDTTVCWEYYPDTDIPFNRLTYFHHYSPYNVPKGDTSRFSSLMLEVCYSKDKKVNKESIVEDSIDGLISTGILEEADRAKIVSRTVYDIEYGYPVPTLDRDDILKQTQPYLMENAVYSRGRYGAWKYEISNMDHCFMQGVEAIDSIISGKKEETWTL